MANIDEKAHDRLRRLLKGMEDERRPVWEHWRQLARFILPRRYTWLMTSAERNQRNHLTNPDIIDATGTVAARVLATGLMNGITSPARPWFRPRSYRHRDVSRVIRWLQGVQEDMMFAMSESNLYNALAVLYLDLAIFHTASMDIFEDAESVFRCYNYPLGEYYLGNNNRMAVDRFAREFKWNVEQTVSEFGLKNCSDRVRQAYERGGDGYLQPVEICCVREPNTEPRKDFGVPSAFAYREIFWEKEAPKGKILRATGYYEWPGVNARWELSGTSPYGTGPSVEGLPDIRQLQHMQKRKLQSLDKMISPPVVADLALENRPMALMPNGVTFVAGANSIGVKPVYTVNPPFGEMSNEIISLQQRIQTIYHNDLFRMISQLDTVRSATEIDARREEKLVLLGPVYDRIQNEVLDVITNRIFGIMFRNGLFDPPPPELQDGEITIEYESILSDARRALDAAPIERAVAFAGNLAGVKPEVLDVFDWDSTIRDYCRKIGVPEQDLNDPETVMILRQQRAQQEAAQAMAEQAPGLAQSAKLLSETQVGGASDALGLILGNQ